MSWIRQRAWLVPLVYLALIPVVGVLVVSIRAYQLRPIDVPPQGFGLVRNCGPSVFRLDEFVLKHFLVWTPSGADLIFDYGKTIYLVDAAGREARPLVATNPEDDQNIYGFRADVSPDSTQIVYAICEFRTERGPGYPERLKYTFELARLDLHAHRQRQLTHGLRFEQYPVWSPDGSRIAFVVMPLNPLPHVPYETWLYVMAADGSQLQLVVPSAKAMAELETRPFGYVGLYPPQWSPNGERLAFITNVYQNVQPRSDLYTVRLDGTGLKRLAVDVVSVASWSPDGERIAIAKRHEGTIAVFTLAADGSDQKLIAPPSTRPARGKGSGCVRNWIHTMSWSPDGSQILYTCGRGVCVVDVDDGQVTRLVEESAEGENTPYIAAWSPDGMRIALFAPTNPDCSQPKETIPPILYTVARDGTDRRDLIRLDDEGSLLPANPPQDET